MNWIFAFIVIVALLLLGALIGLAASVFGSAKVLAVVAIGACALIIFAIFKP